MLNTFSHVKRKEQEFLKDPRNRYGKQKLDIFTPITLRVILMTLVCIGLCFGGMVVFLMHI
jgi:hypothetical protein